MKRIFDHFYQLIGRMTPSQVVFFSLIVVGAIVGTFLIINFAQNQFYAPLYSNLSSEDAGKIVERLEEMRVSYRITDGGTGVSVPSDRVYEVRMKLASAGLPSPQNIGYSLFDQTNLGMTDFVQKVNFRRALEGELARTISGLEEVSAARVHLVIPEDKLFKEDKNPPSASVVLKLRGGSLSRRQLQGIAYIVASSVEGMSAENVTIIDYHGNLLSAQQSQDAAAMLTASQFEMRKNVEQYLEQKAQTLLNSVVGGGRSIVRVTADLNFEQNSTQIEEYDPDMVAVRSEQRSSQRGSESQSDSGQLPISTMNSSDDASDVITNYEVSRTIKSIIGEIGTIRRLTVAVLVDQNYEEVTSPEGVVSRQYLSRSPEDLTRLAGIIKNAVGFSDSRSDLFEIVDLPFDNTLLETSRPALDDFGRWDTYLLYGKKIGTVLLLIAAFFYLKKKLKKVFVAIAKYVPPPPPPMTAPEELIAQKPQKPKLIDTMREQTKGKTDEIAKVIKTIMTET